VSPEVSLEFRIAPYGGSSTKLGWLNAIVYVDFHTLPTNM